MQWFDMPSRVKIRIWWTRSGDAGTYGCRTLLGGVVLLVVYYHSYVVLSGVKTFDSWIKRRRLGAISRWRRRCRYTNFVISPEQMHWSFYVRNSLARDRVNV